MHHQTVGVLILGALFATGVLDAQSPTFKAPRTPWGYPDLHEGSAIDHIGISFPDLRAKMKEFEAAGAKILRPVAEAKGMFAYAYIEDPWGVKIEVMQDSEVIGFHHVHLSVSDPGGALTWFRDHLGGEQAKLRGILDGVRYGPIWLFASRAAATPARSADRAIMSLGVDVADVDQGTAGTRPQACVRTGAGRPRPLCLLRRSERRADRTGHTHAVAHPFTKLRIVA